MSSQAGRVSTNQAERRRRRYPRYYAEFPVTVTILIGSQYQNLQGHCKDVSEAGIGLLIASDLTTGEVASLGFQLPGAAGAWEVRAVLRYRRGYHYGFEFLMLEPERTKYLQEYVQKLPAAD